VRCELVDGADAYVHCKGAAPAPAGKLAVVLGSRGAPSRIVRGTLNATGLGSVAHGAGRRITRSEAVAKLEHRYRRRELATGTRVLCDDTALPYEEHPDVIGALEAHAQATRIAAIEPVVTVKR